MKGLILIIVLCRSFSCACFVLPKTEETTEKEAQLDEEHWKSRSDVPHVSEYTFFPGVARQGHRTVTYRISNYTKKIPRADVDEEVKKIFEIWGNVSCAVFTQSWNASDIEISFGAGIHGTGADDDCPFDEENGVVGHAFMDGNTGYIHFDEDENWTVDSTGTQFSAVAIHEIGHVLGLGHSEIEEAVMYKFYSNSNPVFRLHQDDIEGIQALYGKPGNCSHWPRYPAPPREIPPEQSISFDAVTTFQGQLLIFSDNILIKIDYVVRSCSITEIKELWPILKCGVDAAYEVEGILYVFKGLRYWTVSGDLTNLSSPEYFYKMGLPKNASRIEAAVYDHETKKTLFFIEDEYWRYNEETKSLEEGYPRKIAADFPEIGSQVDAAYQYNGSLYLFGGPNRYEFDRRTYRLIDIKDNSAWIPC